LVPLLHQTYRHRGKIHNRFISKHFYFVLYLSIYSLLIVYPSQAASDDPANQFINNLFNSSREGSNDGNPYV
jgi:hypothetical protein